MANKVQSDIEQKDVQVAQYNNLFAKGQNAAQAFQKRGSESYKSASRVNAAIRPSSNAGVTRANQGGVKYNLAGITKN